MKKLLISSIVLVLLGVSAYADTNSTTWTWTSIKSKVSEFASSTKKKYQDVNKTEAWNNFKKRGSEYLDKSKEFAGDVYEDTRYMYLETKYKKQLNEVWDMKRDPIEVLDKASYDRIIDSYKVLLKEADDELAEAIINRMNLLCVVEEK